jgi:hypothetical protein
MVRDDSLGLGSVEAAVPDEQGDKVLAVALCLGGFLEPGQSAGVQHWKSGSHLFI